MNSQLARAWLLLGLTGGCGAGIAPAFDPHFPDNEQAQAERLEARLAQPPADRADEPALLLATTYGEPSELIAYDLAARSLRFRVALRADSRPELLCDLIVTTARGRLIALDAASGARRFDVPLEGCGYLGAARVGDRLFFTCKREANADREALGELHALDARNGNERFVREGLGALGRPLGAGGLLFVPWQRHSLAVLDPEQRTTRSRGCASATTSWIGRFGIAAACCSARSAPTCSGLRASSPPRCRGSAWSTPCSCLAGRACSRAASSPRPGRAARADGSRCTPSPKRSTDAPRLAHDRFYAVFYRYVFAYDAAGQLVWARPLASDVISARASSAGLFAATERGDVLLLSRADGRELAVAQLSGTLASARFAGGAPPDAEGRRSERARVAARTDRNRARRRQPARARARLRGASARRALRARR